MTRLKDHRQKQFIVKTTIILFVIVFSAIFFLQAGLKSVVNTSVFVNNLTSKDTQGSANQTNDKFVGMLALDEPERATNSAYLNLGGDAQGYTDIEIMLNNVSVLKTEVQDDRFEGEVGKLRAGSNQIYAIGTEKISKEQTKSEIYTVIFMSEKPKLDIESPKEGDKTSKSEILVKGKTDQNCEVYINSLPVVVTADGNFSKNIILKEGDNNLVIEAKDIAGNTELKKITVRFERE